MIASARSPALQCLRPRRVRASSLSGLVFRYSSMTAMAADGSRSLIFVFSVSIEFIQVVIRREIIKREVAVQSVMRSE